MRQRIARLTSSILNPFLVSFITVILLSWNATNSLADALKWTAIALVLSVLPVFAFVVYQVRRRRLDSIFPETQGQRNKIYILATFVGAAGCGVLWAFDAPELLTITFTAGLAAIIIFMSINFYWKISLHTAFIAAAATVLTLVFGVQVAWVFVLLPLVAWARLELKMHTPAQVAAGAALAAAIVTGMMWGFGVVG